MTPKEKMKAIFLSEEIIKRIEEMARREKRSFARQAQTILEEAVRKESRPASPGR